MKDLILNALHRITWRFMTGTGGLLACSDSPDMTAMNEIAGKQAQLAEEQWASAKERQARLDPLYADMLQTAIADSATARERGNQQWDQYVTTFQPLEEKLASTAANYDTAGRRDQAAAEAVAGVQTQFDKAHQQQRRGLSRAGIALDSGRALELSQDAGFAQAKASAGADRAARKLVEDRGIQLVDNAARFGRNQTGTALQAAGQGTGATQAASGIGATGAQTVASGYSGAAQGLSSAGSMYGSIAQQQAASSGGLVSDLASLGKTGAMMYAASKTPSQPAAGAGVITGGSGLILSSKRLKTRGKAVSGPAALDVIEQSAGVPVGGPGRGLNTTPLEPMSDATNRAIAALAQQVGSLEGRVKEMLAE